MAINDQLPEDFSDNSRVWIYQSSRQFSPIEALAMESMLLDFIQQWNSHGAPVKGNANLYYLRFIVLMADESAVSVGGCSTDSSVRVIKEIEKKFNVNMFDRQMLSFYINGKVELLPLSQMNDAIENKFIKPKTFFFDNSVRTKKALVSGWPVPVSQTWLATKFPELATAHSVPQ